MQKKNVKNSTEERVEKVGRFQLHVRKEEKKLSGFKETIMS